MNKKVREKKSGFTLIEILAVIVILGIILFLAVPAVIGLIEKSKGKLAVTSAIEYINEIENKALINDEIDYYGKFSTSDLNELDKSSGSKPTVGFMQINEEEKVVNGTFCIDNYKIHYDGKEAKIDYSDTCDSIKSFVEVIYFNPNTGLECNKVDSSSVNGVKSGCMKWYLYSYNDDSTVDMILDHNTSNGIAWNSDEVVSDGPKEAYVSLKNDTSSWLGVPERKDIYRFETSGYDNYFIDYTGYRAKFLSVNEILKITPNPYGFRVNEGHYHDYYCFAGFYNKMKWSCNYSDEPKISSYSFLYDNTENCSGYGCEFEQAGASGYWTSDSHNAWYNYQNLWMVSYEGGIKELSSTSLSGIRPVITIPLSLLD